MKILIIIGNVFMLCIMACAQPKKVNGTSTEKKINGVSFVASPNKITDSNIIKVQAVNANWVTLMPFGFIRDTNSPNISFNSQRQWWGEKIEGVKETALAFKAKNIKVMVKPQLWVSRGAFTGHIKMNNEADWEMLELKYDTFILAYAKVAAETNCDMFCMGTELNKFVMARPQYWAELIKKIRAIFVGKITYAENWDTYKNVPFWASLDYIGVDAYFPLSDKETFATSELETAWAVHKTTLKNLSATYNKPILFTEYGYRSVAFTAKEPWSTAKNALNLNNQKVALEALFNTFWNEPWHAGGFIWKWYDYDNSGGENNTDYTPQGKPAEGLLKEVYGR
jgi:hypothetical protein